MVKYGIRIHTSVFLYFCEKMDFHGQSMDFSALMNMTQGREENFAYIRRFDWMCARYVGTLLNDDTLKQFFMQGFVKAGIIRGVLEKNPRTLAEAKIDTRDMEHIDKDYERLWRKENE